MKDVTTDLKLITIIKYLSTTKNKYSSLLLLFLYLSFQLIIITHPIISSSLFIMFCSSFLVRLASYILLFVYVVFFLCLFFCFFCFLLLLYFVDDKKNIDFVYVVVFLCLLMLLLM